MANWNVSRMDGQIFVRIIAKDDKDLLKAMKTLSDVPKFRNPEYRSYQGRRLKKVI